MNLQLVYFTAITFAYHTCSLDTSSITGNNPKVRTTLNRVNMAFKKRQVMTTSLWTTFGDYNSDGRTTPDRVDVALRKRQVMTTSLWTTFEGCANPTEKNNSLESETHSRVIEIYRASFHDSYFKVTEEKNIYECSVQCVMYSEVNQFTYFKGLCQCIHDSQKVPLDFQNLKCINNSKCLNYYDGFCASGIGLPFYTFKHAMNDAREKKLELRPLDILPLHCVFQTNATHFLSQNQDSCKSLLRGSSCFDERIIFTLEYIGFVEWTCKSDKRYFMISSIKKVDSTIDLQDKDQMINMTSLSSTDDGKIIPWHVSVIALTTALVASMVVSVGCTVVYIKRHCRSKKVIIQDSGIQDQTEESYDEMSDSKNQYELIDETKMIRLDQEIECDDAAKCRPCDIDQSMLQQNNESCKNKQLSFPNNSNSNQHQQFSINQNSMTIVNELSCPREASSIIVHDLENRNREHINFKHTHTCKVTVHTDRNDDTNDLTETRVDTHVLEDKTTHERREIMLERKPKLRRRNDSYINPYTPLCFNDMDYMNSYSNFTKSEPKTNFSDGGKM